ncbi:TRAP transporter small permease [Oceanobacillus halophilus]|uniref:TRAP transporter small permease n=1 Tax=Oceanobacillus halophilus TaxID=930130 RepID=A0A494ZT63_9BACI|nr:TRAP transporter small permease [Oceanobacillus halophilus]RKQ29325.1 TRAP transporter small permease [Oceanobacillus halophilus]
MQYIKKTNKVIQEIGKNISGLAILSMMTIIVLDVVMRNIFKTSIPGSYVIIENFLMPIAIFPALGYVYMVHILPRLSEFIERRSEKYQRINKFMLLTIDVIVFGLLTYYTFLFFLDGFNNQIAVPVATNFVPLWPIYFVIPVGYLLVLQEVLLQLIHEIRHSLAKNKT